MNETKKETNACYQPKFHEMLEWMADTNCNGFYGAKLYKNDNGEMGIRALVTQVISLDDAMKDLLIKNNSTKHNVDAILGHIEQESVLSFLKHELKYKQYAIETLKQFLQTKGNAEKLDFAEGSQANHSFPDTTNGGFLTSRTIPEGKLYIPRTSISVLREWFSENEKHPYPSPEQLNVFSTNLGIPLKQLRAWFTNERNRKWDRSKQAIPYYNSENYKRGKKRERS
eukprot:snap_masked-scaffold_18-processed-gene-1.36-mRNA-1 protein AED:1.00 eAED:1.00 QI:0/-1/0/0/-1/1/1/0/226